MGHLKLASQRLRGTSVCVAYMFVQSDTDMMDITQSCIVIPAGCPYILQVYRQEIESNQKSDDRMQRNYEQENVHDCERED
jgi:hypothetical protein